MADYQQRTHLKEELKQEELLLKSIKDKLVDQLQRLKVEELAIVNYIGINNSTNISQTASSTGSYFNTNNQVSTETNYGTDEMNNEINCTPLVDLSERVKINSLIAINQPGVEEEDEDDD